MADFKIVTQVDANNPIVGDLYLENGSPRLTQDLREEVLQQLYIRFRFFKGEWFLDARVGMPYFQSILGKKTPAPILSQIFKQLLITTPGVAGILQFQLTRLANRGLRVDWVVQLNDGQQLTSSDFAAFIIGDVGSVFNG